jgi:hypothetical protein
MRQGAYTARMVSMVIVRGIPIMSENKPEIILSHRQEKIGVLDRTQMDNFASVFLSLIARGKAGDDEGLALPLWHCNYTLNNLAEETRRLDEILKPWTQQNSPGKLRANYDDSSFVIKFVLVVSDTGDLLTTVLQVRRRL